MAFAASRRKSSPVPNKEIERVEEVVTGILIRIQLRIFNSMSSPSNGMRVDAREALSDVGLQNEGCVSQVFRCPLRKLGKRRNFDRSFFALIHNFGRAN